MARSHGGSDHARNWDLAEHRDHDRLAEGVPQGGRERLAGSASHDAGAASVSPLPAPPPLTRPGWYLDPNSPGRARYWNGLTWSTEIVPVSVSGPGSSHPGPVQRDAAGTATRWPRRLIVLGPLSAAVLGGAAAAGVAFSSNPHGRGTPVAAAKPAGGPAITVPVGTGASTTVAPGAGSQSSQARLQSWYGPVGRSVMRLFADALYIGGLAHGTSSSALVSACQALSTDVTTIESEPAAPDAAVNSLFHVALQEYVQAVPACTAGAQNHVVSEVEQAVADLVGGTKVMGQVKGEVGAA